MSELQRFKDAIGKDIPKENRDILDAGSAHPRDCKCEICRKWWKLMGPEDGGKNYGPFTREEVERS